MTVNGDEYRIRLKPTEQHDTFVVEVSDRPVHVSVRSAGPQGVEIVLGGERMLFEAISPVPTTRVAPTVLSQPGRPHQDGSALVSPMPGKVMSVMAREGDAVGEGDAIVVIESMKMEVAVRSDRDGTVDHVLISEGDPVKKGQALVKFRVRETS